MRRSKKWIAFVISFALLFSASFLCDIEMANAEGTGAKLEISVAEGYVGDTVTVTVSLKENPGIAGMGAWVCYDQSVLKVVDATLSGDVFVEDLAECQKAGDGYVGYAAAGSRNNSKTGTLFTIQFEIIGGINETALTFSGSTGAPEASNEDGDTVELNLTTGKVSIQCRHTNTTTTETPATCTVAGEKKTVCADCDQTIKTEPIAALGHDLGEYKETKPATCTKAGEETAKCSRCDVTDIRETPALGHDVGEYKETKPATCTKTGEKTAECSRCNVTDIKETPALGHDMGEYKEIKPATCTEAGEETAKCSRCDATDTREIPAKGHLYSDFKVEKDETETSDGQLTATCEIDHITTTWTIPAIKKDNFIATITSGDGKKLDDVSFTEGKAATFVAYAVTMATMEQSAGRIAPKAGSVRYIPVRWSMDGKSGEWTDKDGQQYNAVVTVGKSGTYALNVGYDRQVFDGKEWSTVKSGTAYEYAVNVKVIEQTKDENSKDNVNKADVNNVNINNANNTNNTNQSKAESTEKDVAENAQSRIAAPKTGEPATGMIIFIALSCCIAGAIVVKMAKYNLYM